MDRPYIKGDTLYLPKIDSPTLDNYQKQLEAATTLKTINGMSLLGSGNITIKTTASSGGGGSASAALESVLGSDGIRTHIDVMGDGDAVQLDDYPQSNRRGDIISFRADIDNFVGLKIAKGQGSYGMWFEIDNTNLYVCTASKRTSHAHSLNISEFIEVFINFKNDSELLIVINTYNTFFEHTETYGTVSGLIEVISEGSALTNCSFSATNPNYQKQVWVFGASFESESSSRWVYWARKWGFDNFYLNAYPGRDSEKCFADFERALNYGSPRYLFWTMFGNGSTASLKKRIDDVKALAEAKGFEVILTLRPSSISQTDPSKGNDRRDKTKVILESGCRMVDYNSAVLDPNGNGWQDWRTGYIDNSDGAHPSALGARAIALQIVTDFPEIAQY